jgi:hypothetical protein
MSKHVHFDMRSVEAAANRLDDRIREQRNVPGSIGAQARFNLAVIKSFTLLMAEEANRGTTGPDILDGVAAVLANIVLTYVGSVADHGAPVELKAIIFNNLMIRFSECVRHSMQGVDASGTELVEPMQGGRA